SYPPVTWSELELPVSSKIRIESETVCPDTLEVKRDAAVTQDVLTCPERGVCHTDVTTRSTGHDAVSIRTKGYNTPDVMSIMIRPVHGVRMWAVRVGGRRTPGQYSRMG